MLWFKISVLPTAQKSGHRELRLCIASLEHKLHCSDEYIDFVDGEDACICFNEHLENGNAVFSPASWNACNMVVIISLLEVIQTGVYIYVAYHWYFMFNIF